MADVISLTDRLPQRSCDDCEHAYHGAAGVFCRLYMEEIWDPTRVAAECGDWDPVPWAATAAKGDR